jgi:predicted transposase YdaD
MQESVIQGILREGEARGLERGLQQTLVLRQLICKLGNIPAELPARINSLSIEQLESLSEALFDFNAIADLENWLDNQIN